MMSCKEFAKGVKYPEVLEYFYSVSQVPRPSGDMDRISKAIMKFADENGLSVERDETLNVIIRKPASPGYEDCPSIVITAHMDMVCEKNPGVEHDFFTEPLDLIREADGKIRANGTTLGADDGIGCAFLMAILASKNAAHPAIEAIFTVDEETDMKGALRLDYSKINSKLLLNLDGRPLCGSAAGEMELLMTIEKKLVPIKENVNLKKIIVGGLHGGHTGVDALKERGNAIMLLNRILFAISKETEFQLIDIDGGTQMPSAYARDAVCIIAVPDDTDKMVENIVEEKQKEFNKELANRDHVDISVDAVKDTFADAFSKETADKLMKFLAVVPDGVYTTDHVRPGHLQVSSNTGVLKTREKDIYIAALIRMHSITMKDYLFTKFETLCEQFGVELTVDHDLPLFEYKVSDELLQLVNQVYDNAPIDICDGCLECGIFSANIPDSTVFSLQLPHYFPHSPNEYFMVDDAMECYERILEILKRLKEIEY